MKKVLIGRPLDPHNITEDDFLRNPEGSLHMFDSKEGAVDFLVDSLGASRCSAEKAVFSEAKIEGGQVVEYYGLLSDELSKFIYFNDSETSKSIHPATEFTVYDYSTNEPVDKEVAAFQTVYLYLESGKDLFLKDWGNVIMFKEWR